MSEISLLDCSLQLCEPAFFASREIDRLYLTEALIGNYALTYALGLVQSPYRIDHHRPRYREDLSEISKKGIYVTPAYPISQIRFRVERFNVQTETYWSAYTNGAILFDPAEMKKTKPKPYSNNRPQQGLLKMLAQGMKFRFFIFGLSREQVSSYVRIGKFLSKAYIETNIVKAMLTDKGSHRLTGYYNPLDWPENGKIEQCNVINIHPVPVMQAVQYNGPVYKWKDTTVAADLRFRFNE
jgi:CRISPR-associated protein Csc1